MLDVSCLFELKLGINIVKLNSIIFILTIADRLSWIIKINVDTNVILIGPEHLSNKNIV